MSEPLSTEIQTHIGLLDHLPGMHYMFIPKTTVEFFGGTLNKRLVATVNKKVTWQCGFMSLGEGNAYISTSKKRMDEAGTSLGDEILLTLVEDHSEFGVPVPEELTILFAQDEEGYSRFISLKPGMQRYILNYVSSVKSPDKRIDRAVMLIGNLKKLTKGKETFREILGKPPA